MELFVKSEILTSYIYMDLRLATLKAVSFYLLHSFNTESMREINSLWTGRNCVKDSVRTAQ
jgi:hypothetical protein